MKKLAKLSEWWLEDLLKLLNTPKENNPAPEADKNKKAPKDAKKKGGKDDVTAY